ncbi:uncharacterized protein EI97DRAFT_459160 [Westerdykella ornata]|uniref:Uncharacterized protein n=1 Tax=Westerdykella ornata TaxID=318751 RepID=A0A6A6JGC8_WESOR|nr:uncharacterized protein EI97DRAFT_459160 [Westerdykella ornata]KAF2275700.1 hypothetical protein EI97DRAFT_459160 [Westerdykella ornata]
MEAQKEEHQKALEQNTRELTRVSEEMEAQKDDYEKFLEQRIRELARAREEMEAQEEELQKILETLDTIQSEGGAQEALNQKTRELEVKKVECMELQEKLQKRTSRVNVLIDERDALAHECNELRTRYATRKKDWQSWSRLFVALSN